MENRTFEISSTVKYIESECPHHRVGQEGIVVSPPDYSLKWNLHNVTWVLWGKNGSFEKSPFYTFSKKLENVIKVEDIKEVKIKFNGENRKRTRIVSVMYEENMGITLRSKRKIYLCVIGPDSPKWKKQFNDRIELVKKDFEYYKEGIINGFIDLTVNSPYDEDQGKNTTAKISENFCAFS